MNISIDNSALKLLSCRRRFQLTVIEGRHSPGDTSLYFGSAVHKLLEWLDLGEDPVTLPEKLQEYIGDTNVDIGKVFTLVTLYRLSKKLPPPIMLNDRPAVEVKFSFPYANIIGANNELINVNLVGTIDRIYIDDRSDILVIQDYKTSASCGYGKKTVMDEYDLDFQVPFYLWCLLNSGILPASYKDYLENRRYRLEIHFLFHNETPPDFKTYIHGPFPEDFLSREVPSILNSKLRDALAVAQLTTIAPHDGMTVYKACTYCPFRPACLYMGSSRELDYIRRFPITPYDPLSFR